MQIGQQRPTLAVGDRGYRGHAIRKIRAHLLALLALLALLPLLIAALLLVNRAKAGQLKPRCRCLIAWFRMDQGGWPQYQIQIRQRRDWCVSGKIGCRFCRLATRLE